MTGFNSEDAAGAETTRQKIGGGFSLAAARVKGEEAHSARVERLEAMLSPRSFEIVMKTPPKYLARHVKALVGELSPKNAIRAKCEECVGFEDVPKEVGGCRAFTCPVHAYRPYQPKQPSSPEAQA